MNEHVNYAAWSRDRLLIEVMRMRRMLQVVRHEAAKTLGENTNLRNRLRSVMLARRFFHGPVPRAHHHRGGIRI